MIDKRDEKIDRKIAYIRLTSSVLKYITGFFHREGFTQLMPVILSPITDPLGPDPSNSVIKTGEIEYLKQRLVLTQSMILHKQLAIKSGLKKIFIISPNIRLEDPKRKESKRHLFEFSQVDFEIAHAKREDVFALMEKCLCGVVRHVKSECKDELTALGRILPSFKAPFPRYDTHYLRNKYGEDWELSASMESKQPFWVLCHKREFYDREDPDNPGHYLNYDLVYPEGFGEALSGAEREYEYSAIMRRIKRDPLKIKKYTPYLKIAKDGLVPSAGGGFGVERLVRYITGADHIGDVQLFRRVPGEKIIV